jgi:carboxynorspermidine decarboxylase
MKVNTPAIVYDLAKLQHNLELLQSVASGLPLEILYALKASYAVLPFLSDKGVTGEISSLFEAQLAFSTLGRPSHAFFVATKQNELEQGIDLISHISFNSIAQGERFQALTQSRKKSCGLRVNPRVSVSSYSDYDPCEKGGRFGVSIYELPAKLPNWVDGLHIHALCENGADEFCAVLEQVKTLLHSRLEQLTWLNLGGGHLISMPDYDREKLRQALQDLHTSYPQLKLFIEPGAAFVWDAATLHTSVVDVVENEGVATALLDISFRAHLSDFLVGSACSTLHLQSHQLQYTNTPGELVYRLGGSSCAACDYKEYYRAEQPLTPGTILTFDNMGHYCDVTFSLFNGVRPPSIYYRHEDGSLELKKEYRLEDFEALFRFA